MLNVNELIRIKRREMDVSQEYISFALSITQSQYSRRENGNMDFTFKEITKLNELLHLGIEEHFSRIGSEKIEPIETTQPISDKAIWSNKDQAIKDLLFAALRLTQLIDFNKTERQIIAGHIENEINKMFREKNLNGE